MRAASQLVSNRKVNEIMKTRFNDISKKKCVSAAVARHTMTAKLKEESNTSGVEAVSHNVVRGSGVRSDAVDEAEADMDGGGSNRASLQQNLRSVDFNTELQFR